MSASSHVVFRHRIAPGEKIRVLVVDDSVVVRHLLREALQADTGIELVGSESRGAAALEKIPVLKPDIVTLDVEMPEMDGLETLRRIRQRWPRLRVVMCSSLTTRGAGKTFEALSLGADDYVAKGSSSGTMDQSLVTFRGELIPKIKQFFAPADVPVQRSAPARTTPLLAATKSTDFHVIGIGVSTGGPQALQTLIPQLPADFPLPVLIVQHMPPTFTRLLAERLNAASRVSVEEASNGMEIVPGRVLIAQGDHHLRAVRSGSRCVAVLDKGPHENSCRPAVDVLFRSLAETYKSHVLSVVLTGMGQDGLAGTRVLKAAGGVSLVQDEASSVVWGMPGAVAEAGLADRVVPLGGIVPEILRLLESAKVRR